MAVTVVHDGSTVRPLSGRGDEVRNHVTDDIGVGKADTGVGKGSVRHGFLVV